MFEILQKFHSLRAVSAEQAAKPLVSTNVETAGCVLIQSQKSRGIRTQKTAPRM
jgi:hypothetical protein